LVAKFLIAAPWLIWPVMLTEMANAWWGTRQMLPIAASQAGAPGAAAWQEGLVTATHGIGAIVLIVYWASILRLLLKTRSEQ
jgi:(hydroxyamino)benzene mutase